MPSPDSVSLSGCGTLKELDLFGNISLADLNLLNKNGSLQHLTCRFNNLLTAVDLSGCSALTCVCFQHNDVLSDVMIGGLKTLRSFTSSINLSL